MLKIVTELVQMYQSTTIFCHSTFKTKSRLQAIALIKFQD